VTSLKYKTRQTLEKVYALLIKCTNTSKAQTKYKTTHTPNKIK